jgi:hypothetical protein
MQRSSLTPIVGDDEPAVEGGFVSCMRSASYDGVTHTCPRAISRVASRLARLTRASGPSGWLLRTRWRKAEQHRHYPLDEQGGRTPLFVAMQH